MNYVAQGFANFACSLTSCVVYWQKVWTAWRDSRAKWHFAQWWARYLQMI